VVARTGATTGKSYLIKIPPEPSVFASYLIRIETCATFPPEFLAWFMQSNAYWSQIATVSKGTAQPGANASALRALEVPVPPLNEQHRIVAKIEALQARSDAAKRALDAIGPLLEAFRQSVLAAAFRGDLTEAWREQNPDVEPASALLERIRVERKARSIAAAGDKAEAKARAKALAAGTAWTEADAAKVVEKARAKAEAKYVEPAPVDAEGLPELPEGWCWTTLDELGEVQGGLSKGKKRRDGEELFETPYLRVANVKRGYLDLGEIKNIWASPSEIHRLALHPGDILLNEGGDRDKLGRGWIWNGEIDTCIHQNHVFRLRPASDLTSEYLSYYGNSEDARRYFIQSGKQTTNLASISMSQLKMLPVPLAPMTEQQIVAQVLGRMIRAADRSRQLAAGLEVSVAKLNQSILAKAFRGELVPQDPNDEPASILLERIRAERAAAEPAKKTRRKKKTTEAKPAPAPREVAPPSPTPSPEPAAKAAPSTPLDLPQADAAPEHAQPEDEAAQIMTLLRAQLRGRGATPREALVRGLAEDLGYRRVSAALRGRLDGHLRAAVRRGVLERGGGEEVRLATRRMEDYDHDALVGALRSVTRRGCVYTREDLAREVLAHLGFARLTKGAKEAIKSALNAALRRGVFERVDATQLRRLAR